MLISRCSSLPRARVLQPTWNSSTRWKIKLNSFGSFWSFVVPSQLLLSWLEPSWCFWFKSSFLSLFRKMKCSGKGQLLKWLAQLCLLRNWEILDKRKIMAWTIHRFRLLETITPSTEFQISIVESHLMQWEEILRPSHSNHSGRPEKG